MELGLARTLSLEQLRVKPLAQLILPRGDGDDAPQLGPINRQQLVFQLNEHGEQ